MRAGVRMRSIQNLPRSLDRKLDLVRLQRASLVRLLSPSIHFIGIFTLNKGKLGAMALEKKGMLRAKWKGSGARCRLSIWKGH
uniref:Uncharacterized protein n=1 Tax=Picea glauca TaxID=3330 RepID=A0A117NI07_PICGL|nr:hypothetical protein ABT39_MTgene3771 [Picea glauca]QHR86052.1 hypothetical protein Q903MT_gene50 [Picea sitchensis]